VEALASAVEPAGKVVAHHAVEALGAHGGGGRGELNAGVVEQAVDAAVLRHHPCDRFLYLRFPADVEGLRLAGAARRFDLALPRGELVELAAGDRDVRAERGDLVRRAAADAAAAAGDDDGLAFKQPRLEDR